MSKLITKKEYVEIPRGAYEELLLASNRVNLACEYAEKFDSDLCEDYRVKNLKQMLDDVRDMIEYVAKIECKSRIGASFNPKETLSGLTDMIPFEITRKRREA